MNLSTPRSNSLLWTDNGPAEDIVGVHHNIYDDDFPEDVFRGILDLDPSVDDTRSQIMQFRLPNGDLILGFYPQGDTYFEHEGLYT